MVRIGLALWALSFLPWSSAWGHHAAIEFRGTEVRELEGTIETVFWGNPHIRLSLRVTGEDGQEEVWSLEGSSHNVLERAGLLGHIVDVGDRVRVAGAISSRGEPRMSVTNILLPDGREAVVSTSPRPLRWSDRAIGQTVESSAIEPEAITDERGIFRIWGVGDAILGRGRTYPLTGSARQAQAQGPWVPAHACDHPGMPHIMSNPYPMEVIDEGDTIRLRQEYYGAERMIHMGEIDAADLPPASLMGNSVGHWEGATLVVRTTDVSWPYFNIQGVPQGDDAQFLERFDVRLSEGRLDYELTVTDAATFTEPVVLRKHWLWKPGEELKAWGCEGASN